MSVSAVNKLGLCKSCIKLLDGADVAFCKKMDDDPKDWLSIALESSSRSCFICREVQQFIQYHPGDEYAVRCRVLG